MLTPAFLSVPFFFSLAEFLVSSCVIAHGLQFAQSYIQRNISYPYSKANCKRGIRGKFSEVSWYAVYYTFIASLGAYLLFENLPCWIGFSFHDHEDICTVGRETRLYFQVQEAFYLYSIVEHLFLKKRQKDFVLMLVHHVMSCGVVLLAYFGEQRSGGVVVLFLHDIGDIFLFTTKLLHYARAKEIFTNIGFAGLAITFFVTRLVLFPLTVITHFMKEAMCFSYALPMYSLLISLFFMHIYWFGLIAKMIYKALGDKKLEGDIRSDDEGDSD